MAPERSPEGLTRRNFLLIAAGMSAATLLSSCEVGPSSDGPTPAGTLVPPHHTPAATTSPRPTKPAPTARGTTPHGTPSIAPTLAPPDIAPYLPEDHYIVSGPSDQPKVGISVDDFSISGADDYLSGLLDLGKQRKVTFTFFPIGQALQQYDSSRTRKLWRTAIDRGHIIGNHTWDHDEALATKPLPHIEWELDQQHQIVNKVLGTDYAEYLMRPPGGTGGYHVDNPTTQYQKELEKEFQYEIGILKQLGYWMTMWGTDSNDKNGNMVTPGDTMQQQDDRFLSKIFNGADGSTYEKVQNGSIILVHPTTLSLNGMSRLIDGLHDRGYECTSIPGLFTP